ncbi:MAG: hypothetical protein AB7N54_10845 [Alphaproteobacteria bacterium]
MPDAIASSSASRTQAIALRYASSLIDRRPGGGTGPQGNEAGTTSAEGGRDDTLARIQARRIAHAQRSAAERSYVDAQPGAGKGERRLAASGTTARDQAAPTASEEEAARGAEPAAPGASAASSGTQATSPATTGTSGGTSGTSGGTTSGGSAPQGSGSGHGSGHGSGRSSGLGNILSGGLGGLSSLLNIRV